MATLYTFSLDQVPNYTFRTTLPDAGEYVIGLRYLERFDRWLFDLFDGNGDPIILGKMASLNASMLSQVVDERRPPGDFFFFEDGDTEKEAGFEDMGSRVKLFYVTDF